MGARRYKKDVADLMDVKAQVLVCESSLHDAKWEVEVLQQRFERVKAERDELYARFNATLYEVQQKSGFENLLVRAAAPGCCRGACRRPRWDPRVTARGRAQLEKKLEATSAAVEKKEVQLTEVLTAANLDTGVIGSVAKRLDDVVEAKDGQVRGRRADSGAACRARFLRAGSRVARGAAARDCGAQPADRVV